MDYVVLITLKNDKQIPFTWKETVFSFSEVVEHTLKISNINENIIKSINVVT